MSEKCDTQSDCIDLDLEWVKDELKNLTKDQRRLILAQYAKLVKDYRIGMTEYQAFVSAFDELED
jgi:hypothetical protein